MKRKIVIIAEAGVNHNGKIKLAKKLVDIAAEAGADFVKFQCFKAETLSHKSTSKTKYQLKRTKNKKKQYEMLLKLELSYNDHLILMKYAKTKKIKFLSSAFDIDSIKFLSNLNLDFIKIPSGEITNVPYLREIGKLNQPTILSTGMSTIDEVIFAKKILVESGLNKRKLTVLQCNTDYPSNIEDSNISAMKVMGDRLGLDYGYSDHTTSNESSLAAAALGASIIEKHITINKNMTGPDHFASASPAEFKKFVKSIRNLELALGKSKKIVNKSEKQNIKLVRKFIVAKKIIKKGEIFSSNNLTTIRSGKGISARNWDNIIGKKSNKNYKIHEVIKSNT
jgi:N,N'-diacetyllegionaminate synthase